jgi:hypothetical protein
MPKRKCKIWALVIGALIIAMVQPAVAQPPAGITVWGLVTYDNGTVVPDGWTVSMENLDDGGTAVGEPWITTTDYATWGWAGKNYRRAAQANTGQRIQVSVNNSDMSYIGTATETYTGITPFEINVTVQGPTTVTVVYPNGGEEITIGTSVDVSADAQSSSAVTSVVFEYSSDNGGSWNSIGSGTLVSGTTTDGTWNATWDTTGLPVGDEYLIKANATSQGQSAVDQSDSTFSLVDGTKPIVINGSANPSTIAINTEFTELRVDVADRDSVIDNVTIDLSPIGGDADTRMFNDGNYTQGGLLWTTYNYTTNSSVEGTFYLTVNATDIYGNYNDTVDLMLDVVSEMSYDITIYNGWNLISLPVTPADQSLGAVIGGDAVTMDEIYEYDNVAGYSSSMYTPSGWAGEVTTFDPGKGYWYNRQGSQFDWMYTP